MIKNKLPVRYTGQHFTIDKVLIDDAIKIAKINESDTVIDIGAGKGFLGISDKKRPKISCNPFIYYSFEQKTFR